MTEYNKLREAANVRNKKIHLYIHTKVYNIIDNDIYNRIVNAMSI